MILKTTFKTVNNLKKFGKTNRIFRKFLVDNGSKHNDLLYFSKIRWLSRYKCLKRFFDLIHLIDLFYVNQYSNIGDFSNNLFKLYS